MDNEEGLMYKILRVYKLKGVPVVDRELFLSDKPNSSPSTFDIVYLDNVVGYPILRGNINSRTREFHGPPGLISQPSDTRASAAPVTHDTTSRKSSAHAIAEAVSNS
jgi:hypothetical protein